MTRELIDARVARFVVPVRREQAEHESRVEQLHVACSALTDNAVDKTLIQRRHLTLLPLLLRDRRTKFVGRQPREDVGVSRFLAAVPRGNPAARNDDLPIGSRIPLTPDPLDERNPVQQLEAELTGPGTDDNRLATGGDATELLEDLPIVGGRQSANGLSQLTEILGGRLVGDLLR